MKKIVYLPKPEKELDFPLMKALELRRSRRKWKQEDISLQQLSNLLWAACGITKKKTKHSKSRRTAPSASNSQAIRVYVAKKDGLFLYQEAEHQLQKIHGEDIRKDIGTQKMMKSAPLGLIYTVDYSRFMKYVAVNEKRSWFVAGTDTAFISQNVYLYCAATKLNTVVLGFVDRDKLHNLMKLKENERIVYSQVVGKAVDCEQK